MSEQLKVFQWLESVKHRVSPVTYKLYGLHIRILADYATKKGKEINIPVIEEWLEELRRKRKCCGKTLSIYRSVAVNYLEHVQPGSSAPLKKIVLKSEPRRRDIFTEGELDRIQEVFDQDYQKPDCEWSIAIQVCRATALRLGDVCTLRWDAVLIKEMGLRLVCRKTRKLGKISEIPISSALTEKLAARRLEIHGEYVFPHLAAEYLERGHNPLSKEFLKNAVNAGVRGKSFHVLRNTVITNWLRDGRSAELISQITGQTIVQVMRYARFTLEDKRKALGLE